MASRATLCTYCKQTLPPGQLAVHVNTQCLVAAGLLGEFCTPCNRRFIKSTHYDTEAHKKNHARWQKDQAAERRDAVCSMNPSKRVRSSLISDFFRNPKRLRPASSCVDFELCGVPIPAEMMASIFERLALRDLHCASLVCWAWRRLVWSTLRSLLLLCKPSTVHQGLLPFLAANCYNLQEASLRQAVFSSTNWGFVGRLSNLRLLCLRQCNISDRDVGVIVQDLRHLERLYIFGCGELTEHVFAGVKLPGLSRLLVDGALCDDSVASVLACGSLRELRLHSESVTPSHDFRSLSNLHSLGSVGTARLARRFYRLPPSLHHLELASTIIQSGGALDALSGLRALKLELCTVRSMPVLSQLADLLLTDCQIRHLASVGLFSATRGLTALQMAKVKTVNMDAVLNSIRLCSSLVELRLDQNRWGTQGGYEQLSALTHLTLLRCQGIHWSRDSVLESALPVLLTSLRNLGSLGLIALPLSGASWRSLRAATNLHALSLGCLNVRANKLHRITTLERLRLLQLQDFDDWDVTDGDFLKDTLAPAMPNLESMYLYGASFSRRLGM